MASDELDGPTADPGHHEILFENDVVRVLRTTILAGDTTPVHSHLTPAVNYIVSGSHLIRRAPDGTVMLDTTADPSFVMAPVQFSTGTPLHTIENPGPDDLVVINVELLDRR
jgi:hypothetical protein